jgi:hypothetical protein
LKTVFEQLVRRIERNGRSFAFTAKDFADLGTRTSVDVALSALAKSGKIRRVCRGVYDYPKESELLGQPLAPDFDQVAQAIARNTGARIQPAGAVAANLLGLTTQVPARIVYLTDGLSRTIHVGVQTITFKRTRPRDLMPNAQSALVVHALRFLGREAVSAEVIRKIRAALSPVELKRLQKDARYTADWVAETIRRIASEVQDG